MTPDDQKQELNVFDYENPGIVTQKSAQHTTYLPAHERAKTLQEYLASKLNPDIERYQKVIASLEQVQSTITEVVSTINDDNLECKVLDLDMAFTRAQKEISRADPNNKYAKVEKRYVISALP